MGCFSDIELYELFIYVDPLLVISFANNFSHSVGCHFILFMVPFAVQNPLSLIRSHLFILVFISFASGQRSPTFLAPETGFVEDNFSMDGGGVVADGSGGNASDGERQMKLRLLAHCPLLTSCCAAQFLTGSGPGVGDPCLRRQIQRNIAMIYVKEYNPLTAL